MSDCQFQTSMCYFQFSSYLTSLHHLTTVAESVCWLILSSQIYSNTLTFYIRIPHWILALFISGMMVITRVHSWTSFIPCGWFDHFSGLELSLKVEQISLFKTKLSCYSLENLLNITVQFSHSVVSDSVTPWTSAWQSSFFITNSWCLLKLMSIALVMPSNHLTLWHPLLLLPLNFPSIRLFSNESVLWNTKVLEFQLQHQSFQWIFRTDFL